MSRLFFRISTIRSDPFTGVLDMKFHGGMGYIIGVINHMAYATLNSLVGSMRFKQKVIGEFGSDFIVV